MSDALLSSLSLNLLLLALLDYLGVHVLGLELVVTILSYSLLNWMNKE